MQNMLDNNIGHWLWCIGYAKYECKIGLATFDLNVSSIVYYILDGYIYLPIFMIGKNGMMKAFVGQQTKGDTCCSYKSDGMKILGFIDINRFLSKCVKLFRNVRYHQINR